MPRTKQVRKKPVEPETCAWAKSVIENIDANRKSVNMKLEQHQRESLEKVRQHFNKIKLSIPAHLANKTLGELSELPLNWSGNSTSISVFEVLNATKSIVEKKKQPVTRSSSFGDDDGYRTAESSNGTSGGRMSRARSRKQKSSRISRSLSTRNQKTKNSTTDKFKTPGQMIPPSTYGMITPKVKPNTPQVLLRRPKQGEVALSLQGSPLLTGNVVTDEVANINIPLDNGRLLSIQPQRGLRISQIPTLDSKTRQELEMLRDNLNKVCALSSSKY